MFKQLLTVASALVPMVFAMPAPPSEHHITKFEAKTTHPNETHFLIEQFTKAWDDDFPMPDNEHMAKIVNTLMIPVRCVFYHDGLATQDGAPCPPLPEGRRFMTISALADQFAYTPITDDMVIKDPDFKTEYLSDFEPQLFDVLQFLWQTADSPELNGKVHPLMFDSYRLGEMIMAFYMVTENGVCNRKFDPTILGLNFS